MGWIDTTMIPAKMVNLQAFWNGANKKFIGKPVSHHPAPIETETAITFPVNIACPLPTTVILNFNLLPEADWGLNCLCILVWHIFFLTVLGEGGKHRSLASGNCYGKVYWNVGVGIISSHTINENQYMGRVNATVAIWIVHGSNSE